MTRVALSVNGAPIEAEIEPRTHLADFLREGLGLTGTHLGCEHGVCGACTLLIDGAPARSCIAFAANCVGSDVRSIEGLEEDPVTGALRAAFTAEHALQCGYCTPGMLVTARDIVLRLPQADEDRVRRELAGNLCRCTGYSGIVRAILRVLAAPPETAAAPSSAVPAARFEAPAPPAARAQAMPAPGRALPAGPDGMIQVLRLGIAADRVWAALLDPALVAECVPGARLLSAEAGVLRGEVAVRLGPLRARFAGEARVGYDQAARSGRIDGEGRDAEGGTRLAASADFAVAPAGAEASTLTLDIRYRLRGTLAQFGRAPVVKVLAAEIGASVAKNLEARLSGRVPPTRRLGPGLVVRSVWRLLRGLVSWRHDP